MGRLATGVLDFRPEAERERQRTQQAIKGILDTIGRAEKVRRDRQTLDRVAGAIGEGKTTAEAIEAAGQGPEFGGGLQGILQKISGAFQPPGGGARESILQSIIGQKLQSPKVGAMPWAATQMDPAQMKNWLENYGRGVTIQTGQKLLPKGDRVELAERARDKALGKTGPGFGPGDKKALGDEMDAHIDNAKSGYWGIGQPDYKGDALFEEWKRFIAANTFANDNQRENTWAVWQAKVTKRGEDWFIDNEVDWDPTDPKWREAIGLKVMRRTQNFLRRKTVQSVSKGNQQPKTTEEFERAVNMIQGPEQQEIYYNKWKHLWPGDYE